MLFLLQTIRTNPRLKGALEVTASFRMALCADLVVASDDARIGTPYSRVWGCHLSGMWGDYSQAPIDQQPRKRSDLWL